MVASAGSYAALIICSWYLAGSLGSSRGKHSVGNEAAQPVVEFEARPLIRQQRERKLPRDLSNNGLQSVDAARFEDAAQASAVGNIMRDDRVTCSSEFASVAISFGHRLHYEWLYPTQGQEGRISWMPPL
jgi:hypothetical protein